MVFLVSVCLHGQTLTQTVKGKVLDAATDAPLRGATVTLLNIVPAIGAVTDEQGLFRLENVPVGRQSFLCSYLGYEETLMSEILVGSGKEIDLLIRLEESFQQLDEVVLAAPTDNTRPNNALATVSARSFSVEETKRFPASISDPSRMALSLPGVSNSDDTTNEIVIRGNGPNQLLWRIEGVEVPDPNHFSEEGSSPGAISLLSTNMLGKSDFFTGAFPAEYGNALSGVFDINLRNGNSEKGEYAFQLGILGTDLSLEGPFSKNYGGSYLVNYRYSTLTLLNEFIEVSEGSVPTFQDLSFKVNLPLGAKTNLSLWGIGGISEDNEENAEQINENFIEDQVFESDTYMTGLNVKHFFSNSSTLDAVLSFSGNRSDDNTSITNINTDNVFTERNIQKNNAFRISLSYTKKLNTKTTLKSGVVSSFLNYNVFSGERFNEESDVTVNEKGNGVMTQFFSQAKYKISNKLSSTFGLHGTYFSVNEDFVIEPRAGIEYQINAKHTLSAGIGFHSRRMPLSQYFVEVDNGEATSTPNKNIKLMRAAHYIVGYDWRVIKNGHLKIEAYYQDLSKVAVASDPSYTGSFINGEFLNQELTDTGIGRTYGVEFTFEKFFSDQYYFLATASLFDSKYKAANGNWYNSRYNFNHTISMVGGKEFTVGRNNNNIIGINGKVLSNGGKRGTPTDIEEFNESGNVVFLQSERNTVQFEDYFRLDASIYYRINRPKVAHIISLDVQNVTNRDNIFDQFYNPEIQMLETEYQLSLIPILNYRIEF